MFRHVLVFPKDINTTFLYYINAICITIRQFCAVHACINRVRLIQKNKKTRDRTLLTHFVGKYKMTSPTLEMIGMRRFCNRGHSLMPWTSIIPKKNSECFQCQIYMQYIICNDLTGILT